MKRKFCSRLTALVLSVWLLSAAALAAALPETLVPGGCALGIGLHAEGVLVVGLGDPATADGLKKGDRIVRVGQETLDSASELSQAVGESGGASLHIEAIRNGKTAELTVTPRKGPNGWQLGIYVRDGIAGIGTLTYYDPATGQFGALGHAVNDPDTQQMLPLKSGGIARAEVVSVRRSEAGSPGELKGAFHFDDKIGTVEKNTPCGIFGTMTAAPAGDPVPVAAASEVHPGPATVLCCIDGTEPREYPVEIEKLYPLSGENGRNFMLRITDTALLAKTGGITQGMSGSPILQDGKLIGAVTHVLVGDPTQGYGILLENMLKAAQ